MSSAAFCPDCGFQLWSQWGFCPRCGRSLDDLHLSLWQQVDGIAAPPVAARSPAAEEALALLRSGLALEGEARLRASLHEAPADVELRLLLAETLVQRFEIQEAGALLDEATALAPGEFLVRLRRGEFLARLGRYTDALLDLEVAKGLAAPDFASMLYCTQLRRWVAERAASSFVRQATLPKPPGWLLRVGASLRGWRHPMRMRG